MAGLALAGGLGIWQGYNLIKEGSNRAANDKNWNFCSAAEVGLGTATAALGLVSMGASVAQLVSVASQLSTAVQTITPQVEKAYSLVDEKLGLALVPGGLQQRYAWIGTINNLDNGKENCILCAMAVDDTLAGNPRVAIGNDGTNPIDPLNGRILNTIYGPSINATSYQDILLKLASEADGTRGFVLISRPNAAGHVLNFIKDFGDTIFLDGQTGNVWGPGQFPPYQFSNSTYIISHKGL